MSVCTNVKVANVTLTTRMSSAFLDVPTSFALLTGNPPDSVRLGLIDRPDVASFGAQLLPLPDDIPEGDQSLNTGACSVFDVLACFQIIQMIPMLA